VTSNAAKAPEVPAGPSDTELVERAQKRDWSAFEQIVERYKKRVYGLALRILGRPADAEDVVQQTFITVLEHLASLRDGDNLPKWILRVAANHALRILRYRRTHPAYPLQTSDKDDEWSTVPHPEYIAPWRYDPQDIVQRAEIRELISKALEELDEKYRLVFALRDIEGFSTRETAEMLGITETNAKVRLLRARLFLREKLTRALGDESAKLDHSHEHH